MNDDSVGGFFMWCGNEFHRYDTNSGKRPVQVWTSHTMEAILLQEKQSQADADIFILMY